MASIAKCPKCEAAVLISAEFDSYARVRCPSCQADYPWEDVAEQAVPLPPEFTLAPEGGNIAAEEVISAAPTVRDDPVAVTAGDADLAVAEVAEQDGAGPAGETTADEGAGLAEASADAGEPTEEIGGGTSEARVAEDPVANNEAGPREPASATDEDEPGEEASVEGREEGSSEAESGSVPAIPSQFVAGVARLWNLAPASAAAATTETWAGVGGASKFDFGGSVAAADDHSGFAIHTGEEADDERAAVPGPRLPTRRKRKRKSALREMVEVVVGGFAGLAIGYFLLNLISGNPQFDFLKIPLPWVEHTYKHAPEWWPWKAESDSQEGGAEESGQTPDEPFGEPKQPQPKAKRPSKPRNEPEEEAPDIDPGDAPPLDLGPGIGGLGEDNAP